MFRNCSTPQIRINPQIRRIFSLRSRLQFIPPLVPVISAKPPEGGDWIHEVKYDGYRTQLIIEDGKARAFTKTGLDWSAKYGPVVEAAAALPCKNAILDGEMVVLDERGVSDFLALPGAIRKAPERLVFVAFDLLHLDGFDRRWDDHTTVLYSLRRRGFE